MSSGIRLAPYLLTAVLLAGCSANDLVVKRQAESEAKIEFLIQSTKKVDQRQNELAGLLQVQEDRLLALGGDIKQLRDEIASCGLLVTSLRRK